MRTAPKLDQYLSLQCIQTQTRGCRLPRIIDNICITIQPFRELRAAITYPQHSLLIAAFLILFLKRSAESFPRKCVRQSSSTHPKQRYHGIRCDFDHSQSRSGSTPVTAILGLWEYSQKYYTRLAGVLPKSTPSV